MEELYNIEDMILEFFPNCSESKVIILKNLAVDTIKNYLNDDELTSHIIEREYQTALFLLIHNALRYEDMKGLKVLQQGNKRIEYGKNTYDKYGLLDLTEEVKKLLPVPTIKLMG